MEAHTTVMYALLPLAESVAALTTQRGGEYARRAAWVWYAVAKLLEGESMSGSDRWLRAQLYTSPLAA